jgi:DNA-binding GntR family transcriptional regulator
VLREQAYDRFKERLFSRQLSPGQFVSQRELCELIGVPLGPMREALKRLEAEALVRVYPQRGLQIADINVELIRDAFEIRIVLEKEAARRFAVEGPRELVDGLARATAAIIERAQRKGVSERLLDETMTVDWKMHDCIVAAMNNRIIAEVHRVNSDKIRLIRLNNRYVPDRVVPAMQEHYAVLEAFKQRDPDAAAMAIERHLQVSRRRALGISETP